MRKLHGGFGHTPEVRLLAKDVAMDVSSSLSSIDGRKGRIVARKALRYVKTVLMCREYIVRDGVVDDVDFQDK